MSSISYESRKDVPEEYTWHLEDIFESDEAWFREYEELKKAPEETAAFAGKIGESAEKLLAWMRYDDELTKRLSMLYGYASCRQDQDTADSFYQDMQGKAMSVYVAAAGASAFALPEIMAVDDSTLQRFFEEEPELKLYERAFERLRHKKKHILSAAEEKLLAAAGEMASSPDSIIGAFRDADLRYPDAADAAGGKHALTAGTFTLLEESSDRTLRENAYRTVYGTLGKYKNIIAATLDAQFRQLRFFADARRYPDTLTAALDENEIPVSVYTNLIGAVRANLDKMYRYVALRKKALGVKELHMYDVYVSLAADAADEISFEEAKSTVLEGLAVLGEDYVELLKKGFNERWIDVYENTGKRGGAYSTDASYPHPFVLLNHKNNLDSMFTLAHEMGHALHSWHSNTYQPFVYSDYPIFVAEVASTCNEVLLMKYLLEKTTDKRKRAYLINYFLDQFKGTVYRQTMFAEFELMMGKLSESGETLTADTLCGKYLELNKLYFGPDMISDEEIAFEWARIPHFFYNYYVFQYATGFSAAVAIANRILSEGEPAVRDYKKFLSGGCSKDPIALLKIAGVDMSSPEPVNSALCFFGELTEEMEKLI